MKEKFVINLNKKLSAIHQKTECDGYEIADPKLLKKVHTFINWTDDRVEINFEHNKQHQLKFIGQKICYDITDRFTFKPVRRCLEISDSEDEQELSTIKTKLIVSTFSTLLNVFSPHKREFQLEFTYIHDFKTYTTAYLSTVPDIPQKEWYAKVVGLDEYYPHEVGGHELLTLYRRNFSLPPERTIEELELRDEMNDYCNATTLGKFTDNNFLRMMQVSLAIEDLHDIDLMNNFSLSNMKLLKYPNIPIATYNKLHENLLTVMCEDKINNIMASALIIVNDKHKLPVDSFGFDSVHITDQADYQMFHDDPIRLCDVRITAKILYIFDNIVLVRTRRSDAIGQYRGDPTLDLRRPYQIQFIPNRIVKKVAQRALKTAIDKDLEFYLKTMKPPSKNFKHPMKKSELITSLKWMNPSIKNNKEQQKAVINIINKTSFPSPYVLLGPPGTGKSTAIIEAIAQVIKLRPNSHILVTAGSNSACDDIAVRLLKYVSVNKIIRIYSPIYDTKPDKIHPCLQNISNFRSRLICGCQMRSCPDAAKCDDPTNEEFCTAKVIVCTLMSCGRIVSARADWSNHFDYIFIDEAACQSEQQTLVPIVGLGVNEKGISAQIVLAGDHKQLGYIVKNPKAKKMGMEISMMERIMETIDDYKFMDSNYVIRLIRNYRSHPAIIEFSNQEFYDNKLKNFCPEDIRDFALNWEFLANNPTFPVIFHTLRSRCEEQGTSLRNPEEADIADTYIRVLLEHGINGNKVTEDDIGVITPYIAQKYLLTQKLERYSGLEIGTVDAFQGREKRIIIINTVRSQTQHVGFLRNEKRLNVALTRAQSLLIVIGNSVTLQKSLIWNKFIAYCFNNKAIVGEQKSFNYQVVNDRHYEGAEIIDEDGPEDQYE